MTTKIDRILSLGKIESAKKHLAIYFEKENKNQWLTDKRVEYDELWPIMRIMTEDEKLEHDTDENGDTIEREEGYEYPMVEIDYSDNTEWLSWDEWLNEEVVVEEAETDEDGNVIKEAVMGKVREYIPMTADEVARKVSEYKPLIEAKKKLTKEKYIKQAKELVADYDQYEIDTFITQETEAKEWQANNDADVPLIRAIASARGIEVDELVNKILAKASAMKVAIGAIIGSKQKEQV